MLKEIGVSSMEELFASVPSEALLGRPLKIPPGMSEEDQVTYGAALAEKNEGHGYTSFLGGGSYPHFSPLVIDHLLQRGEFLTAYTPYQPEVSQGTLQSIFEFQTFITQLTGMEVANASVYDGASGTAEAVLMADRLARGRNRVLLPGSLHPHYQQVIATHVAHLGITLETVAVDGVTGRMDTADLEAKLGDDVSALVVQQPNFFGVVEDLDDLVVRAKSKGVLVVASITEALSMALLKPPGESGVDIVAGEAQSFGLATYFGGPYLGFMATRDALKRQLPGRIAGQTTDMEGRRGFVLTLATREQHIRREKATSNICTNQNLMMMAALMYLTLMGRKGLGQVAGQNVSLMHYFLEALKSVPGYTPAFSGPRFNEVTLTCPRPAAEVVAACAGAKILPGVNLAQFDPERKNQLLVAITETKTKEDVDALVKTLKGAL